MKEAMVALERGHERLVRGWTRNAAARNAHGVDVNVDRPEAVEWCLLGSVEPDAREEIVFSTVVHELYHTLVEKGDIEVPGASPVSKSVELLSWNDRDGRKQEEVLELVADTIARLRDRLENPERKGQELQPAR